MNLESDAAAIRSPPRSITRSSDEMAPSLVVVLLVVVLIHGFGSPAAAQSSSEWPIVELRQYTLRPAARDVLIDLFEAQFVESQEDAGMKIVGTSAISIDPTASCGFGRSTICLRAPKR